MNSLLYYYNNAQKMAAYRQAKRMQRGIKLEYQTNMSKFSLSPIYIGANDFSLQYYGNFYYSGLAGYLSCIFDNNDYNNGFRCYGRSYVEWVLFDSVISDGINIPYPTGIDFTQRFNLVITRKGASVKAYINGELKATKEQSEVKDLGDIQFAITRASDVGFVRVWNYALSADDIATLYNNGDPMGYVVPKDMRGLEPVEIVGNNSNTWTGIEDTTYSFQINVNPAMKDGHAYLVNVSISNYESGIPLIWEGTRQVQLPKENGNFDVLIRPVSGFTKFILIYGGYAGTDRRLTMAVNSITPVGLLAEYLPQNIMYGNDNKTIAGSWLDSAKQLPLSDEYMEPLFQSIGGYDMAANGAPEILYNE